MTAEPVVAPDRLGRDDDEAPAIGRRRESDRADELRHAPECGQYTVGWPGRVDHARGSDVLETCEVRKGATLVPCEETAACAVRQDQGGILPSSGVLKADARGRPA